MQPLLRIFWRRAALALLGVFVLAAGVRAAETYQFVKHLPAIWFGSLQAVAVDSAGNVYIGDQTVTAQVLPEGSR